MPNNIILAHNYAHSNRSRFISELIDFLTIPSISTDPGHKLDIQRAAQWLVDQLEKLGFDKIQSFQTPLHPIVYGEKIVDAKAPTILVYGHYDVQPPDPIEEWTTPPFNPQIRADYLYARGASDMKGQVVACLKSIESFLSSGAPTVNIKFILEGEEEIGSPSMATFLEDHKDKLKSDVALNMDTGMISPEIPTITYALRGLAYFEIRLYGPEHDLHSGLFGGIIHNPAQVLCDLISGMHDEQGRITLPGFYQQVRALSEQERTDLSHLPMDDKFYLNQTKAPQLWGEQGYSSIERIGARPTLDVNGILSGFTGAGSKTIIPSYAMAKISMRLVPDQDPTEIHKMLNAYMVKHAPPTVHWEVVPFHGAPACISSTDTLYITAFSKALETAWEVTPMMKREGGSVPVVAEMQKYLGIDSILSGFGLPDDNIHAPNEKLHLPTWYKGIDAIIDFFYNLE